MEFNPIGEIKKALPELEDIKGSIKTVTIENWKNRIKTIQTKIQNKYKKNLGQTIYQFYLNPCIIEYEKTLSGYGIVKFDEEKYKLIRKYLLSDEFNLGREVLK